MAIEAAPPDQEDINWFIDPLTPFDTAVQRGLALRFTYMITATDGVSPLMMRIYQGPAAQLGDYLRAVTRWQTSEPLQVDVAGRTIDGWKIVTWENGLSFILVEVDGTLLALETVTPEEQAMLALLRPLP
jgi:hypothetical protein